MEITLNVKIGITEELKTFIQELAGLAIDSNEKTTTAKLEVVKPVKEKKEKTPEVISPKGDDPAPITLEEVRKVMQPIKDAGKRKELKELLTSCGAESLPDLKEDQYGNFIEKMKTIKL